MANSSAASVNAITSPTNEGRFDMSDGLYVDADDLSTGFQALPTPDVSYTEDEAIDTFDNTYILSASYHVTTDNMNSISSDGGGKLGAPEAYGVRDLSVGLGSIRSAVAASLQGDANQDHSNSTIDWRSAQEIVLQDIPVIGQAVDVLMSLKGSISYQKERGRAATNVNEWMLNNLVGQGKLSFDELRRIPVWAFRGFDTRLYQALFDDARRNGH